jgi:hypothetical protein
VINIVNKIQLKPNLMKSYKSGLRDNGGNEGLISPVSTHNLHDEGSLKMIQDYFKQKKYINCDKYCV